MNENTQQIINYIQPYVDKYLPMISGKTDIIVLVLYFIAMLWFSSKSNTKAKAMTSVFKDNMSVITNNNNTTLNEFTEKQKDLEEKLSQSIEKYDAATQRCEELQTKMEKTISAFSALYEEEEEL